MRLIDLRHGNLGIRLVAELPVAVEEELHDRALRRRPFAGGRHDDHVRLAVAVDVAEGGTGRVLSPADDEHVLLRDAEARVGLLRLDEAPADRLTDVDTGVEVVLRPLDRAVAGQDEIDLQVA